ncbi:MAG: hypothetical protein U0531_08515 [Dehalococcoidia bacterium]
MPPAEFDEIRDEAVALGFRHVESGPLVRSSYHAERQVPTGARGLAPTRPCCRWSSSPAARA